jgi:hypothetical protein
MPQDQVASESVVKMFQGMSDDRRRSALGKMSDEAKQALLAGIKTYKAKAPGETPGASKITGISAPPRLQSVNVGGVPFSGEPTKLDTWLDQAKGDIKTGGQSTVVGRALHRMGAPGTESGEPKNLPSNIVKLGAGLFGGPGEAEMASSMVPSSARSSAQFEDVASFIGKHSVQLSDELLQATKRAAQLANTGLQPPQVLSDWASRLNSIRERPLTYDEARDFLSSATGKLSPDEAKNINPRMKMALSKFARALGDQINKVADQGGFLEEYQDAMREWSQVKKLKSFGSFVVKKAIPAAGALGAAYEGYKRLTGAK